jgi:hypothetical protein
MEAMMRVGSIRTKNGRIYDVRLAQTADVYDIYERNVAGGDRLVRKDCPENEIVSTIERDSGSIIQGGGNIGQP